jgi:anti-sigma B factor antagonist
MIRVTQEERSGWWVVGVSGRADAESADDLENALRDALRQHRKVAADLAALDYISSAGLRAVLQAARAAQTGSAEFAVCSPSAPVKRVFAMSGMHHFLRVHEELPC